MSIDPSQITWDAPSGAQIDPSAIQWDDAPQPERGFGNELVRQGGLTLRHGISGAAAIPAIIADVPRQFSNRIIEGANQVTGLDIPRFQSTLKGLNEGLDAIGLPRPENTLERIVGGATEAMSGVGSQAAAGNYLRKGGEALINKLGELLSERIGTQVVSAGSGGVTSGMARESGAGMGGQILAGLAGGLAPTGIGYGAKELTRRALRGDEAGRQRMLENIKTFEGADTTPTVGQAAETRTARAVESMLSKTPGGAGVMARKAEQQAKQLQASVNEVADVLSPGADMISSGQKIQAGITGFKEGFKGMQRQLYDKLDAYVPKDAPVNVTRTQKILESLNADIPGAPNLSKWFKNAKIQGIDDALAKDLERATVTGSLPYEAIKKLRTLVGNELADSSFMSDVPKSKWKPIYAALSEDLGDTVQRVGPEATKAWKWANLFTKTQLDRMDKLSGIADQNLPEKVFKAATAGTRDGDTMIKQVMGVIPKDARRAVTATVIKKLGQATEGRQNDLGDVFSAETFLTNYNKLSPQAKHTLFNRHDPAYRAALDNLAKITSNIRDGSKVFANPSGTQPALSNWLTTGGAAYALFSGHPMLATGIAGAAGVANVGAKLMTNPEFVKWLATATKTPTQAIPSQLAILENIAAKQPGEDAAAIRQYIEATRQTGQ